MLGFNDWVIRVYGKSFKELVKEIRGAYQEAEKVTMWKRFLYQQYRKRVHR